MEADTPEQFPRYGQYPSLCSADPLPLEILRGGEGKAAHRLPITLHMGIAKECSWTLPGAFSSPEPLDFISNGNHLAKGNDGLWGREWSRYCKLDD